MAGFVFSFLSTLSLRRATVTVLGIQHKTGISIHALLAESDAGALQNSQAKLQFLSTLSLRRATSGTSKNLICTLYFYPRSPCGERRSNGGNHYSYIRISIHALLAESDKHSPNSKNRKRNFYPRSPCGERPGRCRCWVLSDIISIHALLAESDACAIIANVLV